MTADEQRKKVVAAFVDEDLLDEDLFAFPPTRTPTESEITEILAPWRPQKLRHIAAAHARIPGFFPTDFSPFYYIVRTYYDGGAEDDVKFRKWLDDSDEDWGHCIPREHEWFCVLNDPELFNYGDDHWTRVYEVLPELASRGPDCRFTEEHIIWGLSWGQSYRDSEEYSSDEENLAEGVRAAASKDEPWLVVFDLDAFKEERAKLIYRDRKGYPIKETVLGMPEGYEDFRGRCSRGATFEGYWEHAVVANMYERKGKIMKKLLPLVKEAEEKERAEEKEGKEMQDQTKEEKVYV